MSAEAPDPIVLDYIRANLGTFTRDEITRELRLAGHEEGAIAAAWAGVAPEDPAEVPVPEPVVSVTDRLVAAAEPGPFVGRDPAIGQYIRENYGVYTRPAVTTSLLQAGHSREEIEATWAEIAAAEARPSRAPGVTRTRHSALGAWEFWTAAIVTFVSLMILPIVLTAAFPNEPIGVGSGCLLMLGAVATGLIMLAFERTRNAGYGFLAGVGALFALSAIVSLLGCLLVLIVAGICVAALSQSGTTP